MTGDWAGSVNDPVAPVYSTPPTVTVPLKVTRLQTYQGVKIEEVDAADPGDVIILAGIDDVNIGDTISTREAPRALPRTIRLPASHLPD